jgi:hypothetical protein
MEQLKQRIAALEAQLSKSVKAEEEDKVEEKKEDAEKTAKQTLAAEIAALERQLRADDDDDDEDEDKAEEKKASEIDPNGIEEEITQDRFSEVEKITHGQELTSGPSMGSVAPTRSEYVARMKAASARLDKVAEYLERHGRRELAFRIDKIADAIDVKVKEGK